MKLKLKIREVAEARGWNAPRVARRADLGTMTVYNLWDGTTQDPGLLTMLRIAAVIGVPVTDLYEVIAEDDGAAPEAIKRNPAPALAAVLR